jgi:hypothetical protein
MMSKIVAIHQPNFFPWLGYFDKIARADAFVILDDVQFPKTGGVWCNRVKLLLTGEPRWVTAPVDRSFQGTRLINEMAFSSNENWRSKVLKSVVSSYKRAPYFDEAYSTIEPLVQYPDNNVAEFNIHAIRTLVNALGYPVNSLIRSSSLFTDSSATARLIDLTKSVGGNSYLCGGGAGAYQQDYAFQTEGVSLVYQNFDHPEYPQFGRHDFVAGLSIIDALMNLGFSGVTRILRMTEKHGRQ